MGAILIWGILIGGILALAFYVTRVAKLNGDDDGRHDTGLAILEFGRAFPGEAIRSLHATADGNAYFVRLHDGKAGVMRNRRNHFACHLIQPGRVRISPLSNSKGFTAEFLDAPTQNGTFVFRNEKEAAEVSLWLLDNYVSIPDRELPSEDKPADTVDRAE